MLRKMIKNLSRLLQDQQTKKHATHYYMYCRNCITPFTSKERLAVHEDLCHLHETVKIEMPDPDG